VSKRFPLAPHPSLRPAKHREDARPQCTPNASTADRRPQATSPETKSSRRLDGSRTMVQFLPTSAGQPTEGNVEVGAGWSSLVARRAHNPKVASSNLAPATRKTPGSERNPAFFCSSCGTRDVAGLSTALVGARACAPPLPPLATCLDEGWFDVKCQLSIEIPPAWKRSLTGKTLAFRVPATDRTGGTARRRDPAGAGVSCRSRPSRARRPRRRRSPASRRRWRCARQAASSGGRAD
jgi:hypothetical protein